MGRAVRNQRGGSSVPALAVLALLGGAGVFALLDDGKPDVDLTTLAASSTHATISAAPPDAQPFAGTDGLVVHPRAETAVYSAPEGEPFAKIGPSQFGPTWLPVVERTAGWVRVLLPSKPNRSTGWLPDEDLDRASSPYLIRVHTGSRRLELFERGKRVGRWRVGVGARKTPTPPGRTFVLGSIVDPHRSASPVVLPLGAHSPTLDTYGGGPGTVAIHGWPRADVFGAAISAGCVRVPQAALVRLQRVPLGTLVLIDSL
ncbi:ErfK/YbiS/YcfS/YnhG family protein [Kribbella flavida DSM 17836]|uniref:ErfK/YbiS/YcfS/YnhG family protein n=1 Tax=Kribbella flavida (strain DSM 17836 / JCM 10339 / NBRC 14399) TaxID=479435 RepID=D2PPS9_KRIFD|nr:L,D-transpeptidase [Kribbella flavida]ADB32853.1 ErfK/YbiS/YcfS/YnhG family protein [Kribbella flavida DSM 17836]